MEIIPANEAETAVRVEFFGDEIDRITQIDVLTGEIKGELEHAAIFPASHYVVPAEQIRRAADAIEKELEEHPELADLSPDDSVKDRLYAQIEEYETQKALSKLSEKDREALVWEECFRKSGKKMRPPDSTKTPYGLETYCGPCCCDDICAGTWNHKCRRTETSNGSYAADGWRKRDDEN